MSNKKSPSFESRLARLQEIITALEGGDKPLEESVTMYKEGLEHTRECRKMLAQAKHEISVCSHGLFTPWADQDGEQEQV